MFFSILFVSYIDGYLDLLRVILLILLSFLGSVFGNFGFVKKKWRILVLI